jgi:L-cysteine desulfidase
MIYEYKVGECISVANGILIKKQSKKLKVLNDIETNIANKMFNFKNKTITTKDRQVMFELIGFLNLIHYSEMQFEEIKHHLDNSNLLYM